MDIWRFNETEEEEKQECEYNYTKNIANYLNGLCKEDDIDTCIDNEKKKYYIIFNRI